MEIDWNELDPSDLPPDLQEIRDALGDNAVHYLIEYWGGTSLYIPSLARLQQAMRDRAILKAFDGTNEAEIVRRFGVSRRSLRRLTRGDD